MEKPGFYKGGNTGAATGTRRAFPVSPQSYAYLQRWIESASGIVLDNDKSYLLQARLAPLLLAEEFPSFDLLCDRLRDDTGGLGQKIVDALTTSETHFFRDRVPFETLRTAILPQLAAKHAGGGRLSIWSAAASSGQEVYSLAMLLLDLGYTSEKVDLLASDISQQALSKAEEGTYNAFEMNRGLPPGYLEKYFDAAGNHWRIKQHVRDMVRFQRIDLRAGLRGVGPFDIVLCRNVLIYFAVETKEAVVRQVRQTLIPGGYLMLGAGEALRGDLGLFRRVIFGQGVAYEAT